MFYKCLMVATIIGDTHAKVRMENSDALVKGIS